MIDYWKLFQRNWYVFGANMRSWSLFFMCNKYCKNETYMIDHFNEDQLYEDHKKYICNEFGCDTSFSKTGRARTKIWINKIIKIWHQKLRLNVCITPKQKDMTSCDLIVMTKFISKERFLKNFILIQITWTFDIFSMYCFDLWSRKTGT